MVWGVGLIPQGRRALADWQYRRPVGVSGHHARGAADQRTGDLQTTDGHRHVFRQAVAVDQLDIVAVPDANGWPHIATVNPHTEARVPGVNDQCARCSVKNSGCPRRDSSRGGSAAQAAGQRPVPSAARRPRTALRLKP